MAVVDGLVHRVEQQLGSECVAADEAFFDGVHVPVGADRRVGQCTSAVAIYVIYVYYMYIHVVYRINNNLSLAQYTIYTICTYTSTIHISYTM